MAGDTAASAGGDDDDAGESADSIAVPATAVWF